jgi:hypothetical protein
MKFNGLTFNGLTVTYEPPIIGQIEYTTPGTYYWTVPQFVESISVVSVGGGQSGGYNSSVGGLGGSGGWLAYRNNYTVTQGDVLTIVVGSGGDAVTSGSQNVGNNGNASTITINATVILNAAPGYTASDPGITGQVTYSGGGGGGAGSGGATRYNGGGGGAGGYAGIGGNGSYQFSTSTAGAGGGGGGGGGGTNNRGTGGGGVGIYGQGSNGTGGALGTGGGGGSSGTNGSINASGVYGGGGGGNAGGNSLAGGGGAVRIIYPGATRYFPSTGTANQ